MCIVGLGASLAPSPILVPVNAPTDFQYYLREWWGYQRESLEWRFILLQNLMMHSELLRSRAVNVPPPPPCSLTTGVSCLGALKAWEGLSWLILGLEVLGPLWSSVLPAHIATALEPDYSRSPHPIFASRVLLSALDWDRLLCPPYLTSDTEIQQVPTYSVFPCDCVCVCVCFLPVLNYELPQILFITSHLTFDCM